MKARKSKSLRQLFMGILTVNAFTFGGGFVIVTFLKKKFVDELHWIDEGEMLDYIALAQSTPGSIAVNASILIGWKTFGFAGMLVAVLASILPPMVILGIISMGYAAFAGNRIVALMLRGMQAGVAAVIMDAVLHLGGRVLREKSFLHTGIMITAFIAAFFLKVNVVLLILAALAIGVTEALIARSRRREGFRR